MPLSWIVHAWACARCASWSHPTPAVRLFPSCSCLCHRPVGARDAGGPAAAGPAVREELTRVLAQLTASAERTTMGGRMGYAGDSLPDVINLCRAVRFLDALPAAERYELLKAWMFPSERGR